MLRALALCCALQAGVTPGGGFSNGLPSDPSFFPVGVWLQHPRHASRYAEMGINVYVGLHKGPTKEQIDALESAGIYAICNMNKFGRANLASTTIVGWMQADEPDNAQSARMGFGKPTPPRQIKKHYDRMRAEDPTRPVFMNLGQGAAWDAWHGRGARTNHPEDYPRYLEGCDIVCFDIYPVTHEHSAVRGKLGYIGRGVARLRGWSERKKPVWAFIETTHIQNKRVRPTPEQVRSEVWMALIHGARGFVYFAHEWEPEFNDAGLLAYPEIQRAVASINARVHALAPILNSPTPGRASVETANKRRGESSVSILCKRDASATYVFAVGMNATPTSATFRVPGGRGPLAVEVLGEDRSIDSVDGSFRDEFDGFGVHLYRVPTSDD